MSIAWDGLPPPEWRAEPRLHYLRENASGDEVLAEWNATFANADDALFWWIADRPVHLSEIAADYTYISVVPTSTEIAALCEEITYLRAAIEDEQITCEIPPLPMHDYASTRAAIQNAIRWNCDVALNPAVSEDARKLQAQAKAEAMWEAVAVVDEQRRKINEFLSLAYSYSGPRSPSEHDARQAVVVLNLVKDNITALIEKEKPDA
jgi:hypothetical protein